jgi:hypothetical protein
VIVDGSNALLQFGIKRIGSKSAHVAGIGASESKGQFRHFGFDIKDVSTGQFDFEVFEYSGGQFGSGEFHGSGTTLAALQAQKGSSHKGGAEGNALYGARFHKGVFSEP